MDLAKAEWEDGAVLRPAALSMGGKIKLCANTSNTWEAASQRGRQDPKKEIERERERERES